MSPKSWEQAMTESYWDYRWRQIMEPLCETFRRWKAGELSHDAIPPSPRPFTPQV